MNRNNIFKTTTTWMCPFCRELVYVDRTNRSIAHSVPTCDEFNKLDGDDYLEAVRKRIVC